MEGQDITVDEGSVNQGGNINRSGNCSADPTVRFVHLVAKVFNFLSGLLREPNFLQGLDKRANGRRIDMFLLLGDGAKYLGPRGVISEVIFFSSLELDRDGLDHSVSVPREVVAV